MTRVRVAGFCDSLDCRGYLCAYLAFYLRASLFTSKAAFFSATSAPLATAFRGPHKAMALVGTSIAHRRNPSRFQRMRKCPQPNPSPISTQQSRHQNSQAVRPSKISHRLISHSNLSKLLASLRE